MRQFQGRLVVCFVAVFLHAPACYADSSSSNLSVAVRVVNSCLLSIDEGRPGSYDSGTTLLAKPEEVLKVDCELESHFDQRVEMTRDSGGDVDAGLSEFPLQLLDSSMANRPYSNTFDRVENPSTVPPVAVDVAESQVNAIILPPPLETASAPNMGLTLRATVDF